MEPIFTLVIEDDERIGSILAELVSSTPGFSLLGRAESLTQADLMMRAAQPQLLLVDISLPDGSGLEWVNRLRSHNREAYVIMVTASCDVETIQQALNQGCRITSSNRCGCFASSRAWTRSSPCTGASANAVPSSRATWTG